VVTLVEIGLIVLGVGFVALIGAVLQSDKERGQTTIRGGGVVMIGPIPIIFGSDAKWASIALILAIALVVISVLVYLT